jgi:hypothetical protein
MKNNSNSKPEIDIQKIKKYGAIKNDSPSLADKEFMTEERSEKNFYIFNKLVIEPMYRDLGILKEGK